MTRPCYLVVDREYAGSISTRKLVIETAKLNVITAYSGKEAVQTLERFPKVDGVVLDAGISDMSCQDAVSALKKLRDELPIVVIGTPRNPHCGGADHLLESFDPAKLLLLLQRITPEVQRVMERETAEVPTE